MNNSEQILEKHLTLMLGRVKESIVSIEEMKKLPEWQTVLNAMEEYAINKMIVENQSLLSMALLHMDSRAVLVLNDRISTLEKQLSKL